MKQNLMKRLVSAALILCVLLSAAVPFAQKVHAAASPSSSANASATLAYNLKNLKFGVAVQNFYIGAQYLYITQRSNNITYLSRLTIDGKTATYKDHMTLTNWGHGETLDFYTYNGKEYFLVGSKANAETTSYWSTQIARIQYEAGKTYDDYTGVTRFTKLNRCNSDGSSDGEIYRAAAAVCGDYTIFRLQIKDKFIRYTFYDTKKLNAALDSTTTSVYLEMNSSGAKGAFIKSFTQSGSTYVHPNGSFQGIELSSKDSIYLTGGGNGETPQIAMMNYSGAYKKLITVTNVGNFEIEAGQADRGKFYFAIVPDANGDGSITSAEKKSEQKIYYVNESTFGVSHTITNVAGKAATCTSAGLSDGASCSHCNCPQDVQEVLPALGHNVVILPGVEPTATSNGLTEGKQCSRCGTVLVAQEEIGAADYSYVKAEPLQVVIDYDKYVRFTMDELHSCLNYNSLDASVSFVGVVTEGSHENICYQLPEALELTKEGERLRTAYGTFIRQNDTFLYTPETMIEHIDTIYAVFHVKNIFDVQWYIMVAVSIVPATTIYYEAEALAQNGSLVFRETVEDDVNESADIRYDEIGEAVEIATKAYDPTYDQQVLYFSFDNTAEDRKRYAENAIYGNVNHDLLSNWSVFGAVTQYSFNGEHNNPTGALNLHLSNPGASGTWLQLRSSFSLQYTPCSDLWIEVRMRLNDVRANNGASISFCPEFFAVKDNTTLRTRPSTSISLSQVGTDWFVLKFPYVQSNAWPTNFNLADSAQIRSLSMTFEGMLPNYGQSISIDYFYLGPEEKCPSVVNADSLYFGFDNSAADQYRYNNPIYGKRNNFDKTLAQYDDWGYNPDRTPTVSVANGNLHYTVGAKGSNATNSPWVQTMENQANQAMLDFAAGNAECAQVKLKFSGLTTKIDAAYELDGAIARLGFVLDDDATYEDSSCWYDWPLTEELLNGCDYVTLTADIIKLLAERNAKRIRAVRLTILNAASLSGTSGTVDVDYIYIGKGTVQGSTVYIPESDTQRVVNPTTDRYSPTYDEKVLYFGFDNAAIDKIRYGYNNIYGNTSYSTNPTYNYDANGSNIRWAIAKSFTKIDVTGGNLTFSGTTVDSWGHIYTKDNTLKYTPTNNDYLEIRLKVDSAVSSRSDNLLCIELVVKNAAGKQTKFNNASFSASKVGKGYFVLSVPINNSSYWNDSSHSTSSYTGLGTITRVEIIPSWLKTGSAINYSIDYFYLGPSDRRPSQRNQDFLYFGFDNEEAAQYRYASDIYGANYDAGNWDYNKERSTAPSIANGMMSANIVLTKSSPWFETKLGGYAGSPAMSFYPNANTEVVQLRVRFNKATGMSTGAPTILAFFFDASNHQDSTAINVGLPISLQDLQANGKWFTYRIPIGNALSGMNESDSLRISFSNITGIDSTATIEIDYIYVGPYLTAPRANDETTYGYDEIYANDSIYSDHATIFSEGKGVPLLVYKTDDDGGYELDESGNKILLIDYSSVTSYTDNSFSFRGTGCDIIGRTGKEQGALRIVVCAPNGDVKRNISVINKGETELYQVNIASIKDLPYDTYTVHIFVNEAYDFDDSVMDLGGALDRGNEFYFDAVRIYSPMNNETTDSESFEAQSLYQIHAEAAPTYTELREILIDAGSFGDATDGVVYLDATAKDDVQFDDENGKLELLVAEYKAIGPNNEIYLQKGNAIAFKLIVDGALPTSVDLGAKSVNGAAVTLCADTSADASLLSFSANPTEIATCTDMYYPLAIDAWGTDENGQQFVYVAVQNTGNGILSLTNLKFGYSSNNATNSVNLKIDNRMLSAFGLIEEKEPASDENLNFHMAISIGAQMQVVYTVQESTVAPYEHFYLEIVKTVANAEPVRTIFSLDRGNMTVNRHPANGEIAGYSVAYTGIFASMMGDDFTATLYAVSADGSVYHGLSATSSIKSYLLEKLEDENSSAALKTLAVDMLNYGAAAQIYFGYDAENLVNGGLTEAQKLLGTQNIPAASNYTSLSGAGCSILADISLQSKVMLYLTCLYAPDETAELKFVVKDNDGRILQEITPTKQSRKAMQALYDNVGAKQMRELLTIELYDKSTLVSKTYTWSVESYVASVRADANSSAELVAVANAMLIYGDSAAIYLAETQ